MDAGFPVPIDTETSAMRLLRMLIGAMAALFLGHAAAAPFPATSAVAGPVEAVGGAGFAPRPS